MDASAALGVGLAAGFALGTGFGLVFYLFMRRIDQALAAAATQPVLIIRVVESAEPAPAAEPPAEAAEPPAEAAL